MSTRETTRYLASLAEIQQEILAELTELSRHELTYATDNGRWNTVRRVMLRFGDHLREHTTQLIAARETIGAEQSMPQRMLARAQEASGVLLGAMVGLTDEALDRVPDEGEWTPRQVLEHIITIQELYLDLIRRGREAAQPVEKD